MRVRSSGGPEDADTKNRATKAGASDGIRPVPHALFDRAFFLFGLRRGGNHAILEWLRGHFDENKVWHLNDADMSLLETDGKQLTVDRIRYSKMPVPSGKTILIVGYENIDPMLFPLAHNARIAHRSDVVVVLRDYPNNAASIVKQAYSDPAWAYSRRISGFPELWKRYAEYLESGAFGHTYISYNKWFVDLEGRRDISRSLGLKHSDRGLGVVNPAGRGSSFEGMRRAGRAQEMNVLNRWQGMFDHDLFQFLLLADDDVLEMSRRLFGGFPHSRAELLARWRERGARRAPEGS